MAPQCDHARLYCVHNLGTWQTPYGLSRECAELEKVAAKITDDFWRNQPEPLSENETDSEEEAEFRMDNMPSPKHKRDPYWNPTYEARRQARKSFCSPPNTPPANPPYPYYSWVPSPPSPTSPRPPNNQLPTPSLPDTTSLPQPARPLPLPQPLKPKRGIRKAKSTPWPLRRPTTRSAKPSQFLSLHSRKAHVLCSSPAAEPYVASYDDYVASISSPQGLFHIHPDPSERLLLTPCSRPSKPFPSLIWKRMPITTRYIIRPWNWCYNAHVVSVDIG